MSREKSSEFSENFKKLVFLGSFLLENYFFFAIFGVFIVTHNSIIICACFLCIICKWIFVYVVYLCSLVIWYRRLELHDIQKIGLCSEITSGKSNPFLAKGIRSRNSICIHLFIQSFTYSFINLLLGSFIRSMILSFVCSFIHIFIHSFIHLSFCRSFTHLYSIKETIIISFICSFIHLFIYLLIVSFSHSFNNTIFQMPHRRLKTVAIGTFPLTSSKPVAKKLEQSKNLNWPLMMAHLLQVKN